MQNIVNKLRFPVIVGSFVIFTYFGTQNFKAQNQERIENLKRRTNVQTPEKDQEEHKKLRELKGTPSWER
jgi:hypothetical protein